MGAKLSEAMTWGLGVRIFERDIAEGIRECSPLFPAVSGLGLFSGSSKPEALSLLLNFHTFTFSPGLKSLEVKSLCLWYIIPVSVSSLLLLLSGGTEHSTCCWTKKQTLYLPQARERWAHTPPSASRTAKCAQGIKCCQATSGPPAPWSDGLSLWKCWWILCIGHGGYWGRKQFL